MKRKTALFLCAVMTAVCAFSGCVRSDDPASTSGRNTTTTSSTSAFSMDGEYEAGKDGIVTDDREAAGTSGTTADKDMIPGGSSAADRTDIINDGNVPGTSDTTGEITKDEAAFASSYIRQTSLSEKSIGWGLGKERDDKNRPVDAVRAEEKYAALGGRFLAADGKICLTFDEGYENGYTGQILDTLAEKGVKAVFFVTYDYCRTAPELVKRMIDEGHIVGNHTWSHPSLPSCTQKEVWAEVTKLHDYMKSEFGYEMTLFRFPKGEFSERTLDDVHNLGYTSLFWSFAYEDWDVNKHTDPAEALAAIEASTHSGIYLLHAVSETNAKILAPLIDYWTEHGYSVGTEL